jgi:DNA (cytosine-5)-methyltransferase 1
MKNGIGVIDLFCGCGGLSEGFRKAGFNLLAANDNWETSTKTFKNNHGLAPILGDINKNDVYCSLLEFASGAEVVVGGPPCQAFSTAGKRLSIKDPRGNLILDFIRFVKDIQPKVFVMENVRGILSAAISHRPLNQRSNGVPLKDDEKLGSALKFILKQFKMIGYKVNYGLLNAADYGVPQKRQRVFFLGSRDGEMMAMPEKTHSGIGDGLHAWRTLRDALNGLKDPNPEHPEYNENQAGIFSIVPPGGYWRNLPKDMHKEALGGAYGSGGGKVGFFRRLSFDLPSPTLVTSPTQKGTAMCHPEETRPLTVREYARIQQFPDHWVYSGSMMDKYKQIGNAVPVGLSEAVAKAVRTYLINNP